MPEAYIIDAVRTPLGRKKGSLSTMHPADLGAVPLRAIIERTGIDPEQVDDVIFGVLEAIGPNAGNLARTCWLAAGLPEAIPAVAIDRQCGSGQQAVHFAAFGVMSGQQDLVIAGGVQQMNAIPILASMAAGNAFGFDDPFSGSTGFTTRYGDEEVNQYRSAELIAERWNITREEMEQFALTSHQRADTAIREGRFKSQITPVGDFTQDETVRPDTTLEKMASLKTLREGGRIHAGIASQNADASAAMLIASEKAVREHGLKPRARIHYMTVRGDDPVWMLTAPIPATRYAFEKSGLTVDDIDLFECNEAFASVPMAWMQELGIPHEKTNVNGGAIALGHPLGATGVRLMTTMLAELERTGGKYGLQTMCEGGGLANVTIIERL
ncbi:acetyl-CoA acetyltransferase [Croceicoccus estronivorus]|uniref:acetyl-CoA C-acetyltransferase n=1 Tax=Croceicoccus estronivorus TaxID=1172626 RepID=UPI00083044E8|nr:acetyl-CoA C-acetyltransferase [Croceicoccus estronivorus]OCC23537.1 acetyl-CoA acetyltransferase [Croceicoccus estronivorus]